MPRNRNLALSLTLTLSTLAYPALAQQGSSDIMHQATSMACTSYKDSLVNVVSTTTVELSRESLQAQDQTPISSRIQLRTVRQLLEGLIESESNQAMKRIITRASNDYLRSQNVESFSRGLNGLVDACIAARTELKRQQQLLLDQAILNAPSPEMNVPSPPKPGANQNDRNRTVLPARDSYL